MHTQEVFYAIQAANTNFIKAVRKVFDPEESKQVSDEDIFEALSDTEYSAMLTGWLLAKDLYDSELDLRKENNL